LSKQLNVMQTTATARSTPQPKRGTHQTQYVGVARKSNAECSIQRSSTVSCCCTEDGQKVDRNVYRIN